MATTISRPEPGEYASFYAGYVDEAKGISDLLVHLARQGDETRKLFTALTDAQAEFRYAPGKWSIKDIVLHLADAERVFSYRLLTFARKDSSSLPSFAEDGWAASASAGVRGIAGLAAELHAVRSATVALLRGVDEDALTRQGIASVNPVSVRALAWIIAGHELHHLTILRERYLRA